MRQGERVPQAAVGEPEEAAGVTARSEGQVVQPRGQARPQGAKPVLVDRDPVPLPPYERTLIPFVHLDVDPRVQQSLGEAQPGQPGAGDRDRGFTR
jgi:hypothetical protein